MAYIPLRATEITDISRNGTVNVESINIFDDIRVGNVVTFIEDATYVWTKPVNTEELEFITTDVNITFTTTNPVSNTWTTEIASDKTLLSGAMGRIAIDGLDVTSTNGGKFLDYTAGTGVIPILFMTGNRILGFDAIGDLDGVAFAAENTGYISNGAGWTMNDMTIISLAEQNFVLQTGDHVTLTGTLGSGFLNTILATPGSGDAVFNIDSSLTITNEMLLSHSILVTSGGGTWFDSAGLDQFDVGMVAFHNINIPDSDRLVSKSADYTILKTDGTIKTTGSISFTLTLPTAVGVQGKEYNIKHTGTGTITLDADGTELIDDVANIKIRKGRAGAYPNLKVKSDNIGWMII